MWLDWEGVIIHDVLDNVFFCLVFVLVQVICVQSVTAAYLCWAGWLEVYGMIVSMKVGFLYMDIFQFVGVL